MAVKSLKTISIAVVAIAVSLSAAQPGLAAPSDEFKNAVSVFNQKQYEAASGLFTRVAQKERNITATYYLALCYQNLKREDRAVELFRFISKNYPNSPEAKLSETFLSRSSPSSGSAGVASASLVAVPSARVHVDSVADADWQALPQTARIPFQMKNNAMYVKTKVNGRYMDIIFDTGAEKCVINLRENPGIISDAEFERGAVVAMNRPGGVDYARICPIELSIHNITRKIPVMVAKSDIPSLIGQNFFKEYSYEVDGFYLRLTKMPKPGSQTAVASLPSSGKVSTGAPVKDKYSVSYEKLGDVMLVNIEVNGHTTKACFDTGCGPDGIVLPPSMAGALGIQENSSGAYAENVTVGPITRKYVKAYPAGNLRFLLIGPKFFGDRRYTVDSVNNLIKFQY